MLAARASLIRLVVVLAVTSSVSIAQEPAQSPSSCVALADSSIPTNSTIEAKVVSIDSSKLKPGKDIWLKVARGVIYQGCTLEPDSVVYARVLSASGGKGATSSELSLAFDRADCSGHDKQPFKLRVIAVVAPADHRHNMHDDMPSQVSGGGRQIESVVAGTSAVDMDLNPGGSPHTVHPGIVIGIPNLKLEPTAGPECSDKLTSTASKIQLGTGSEFLLAPTQTH
jgi:hypothetical protein